MLMIAGPGRADRAARVARKRGVDPVSPSPRVEPAADAAPPTDRPDADLAAQAAADRERAGPAPLGRPFAPLVAQLIAGVLGLPQTRARRRAEPSHATRAYGRRPAETPSGALYEATA
ncbi:hypothetical protein JOD31_003044 [Methylopila capsulata]|uniref:Uncharacterized protein n=1 Tax=Methylopila capsulata TaxID=61654 RepID=A0A9W6MT88_9HYPH|nr:hypothetical protein [Methylopila capsulata]MBM7852802.1 hypothetical protein [Methylopila capsulata]GLK57012.1 hypothetical protein GCM10008170_30310 [Methylopila capsulata]